jgi:hypothetical protein
MAITANRAITSLYLRFSHECRRFSANQREMEKLSDAYFTYRDFLHEQERRATRIVKMFGVLGVYSPDTSAKLTLEIKSALGVSASDQISSSDVRDRLKLWEILELFLSAVDDKATVGDFRSFLFSLDIKEGREPISTQAINSAIKTHPELFEEIAENGQRFLAIRSLEGTDLLTASRRAT